MNSLPVWVKPYILFIRPTRRHLHSHNFTQGTKLYHEKIHMKNTTTVHYYCAVSLLMICLKSIKSKQKEFAHISMKGILFKYLIFTFDGLTFYSFVLEPCIEFTPGAVKNSVLFAGSRLQTMGDYLFRKTLLKLNHHLLGLGWILNVIFIDEQRLWAQRSRPVGGGAWADINHVFSMPLPFGALGRLGLRLLREHPLQRPLVDGDFTPK